MDHHGNGTIAGFYITISAWLIAKIIVPLQDMASFVAILVGISTLFINWPKIKARAIQVYKMIFKQKNKHK